MLTRENRDDRSVRETNQSRVLQALKKEGPSSRTQLARITDLNPSTISRTVNDLRDLELVREKKMAPSSGGRKPVLVDIDKDKYHVIGVDVGATKIIAAVINLAGEIVDRVRIDIDYKQDEIVELSPEAIPDSIEKLLESYEENKSHDEYAEARIIGIGVGAHGLVDTEAGVSLFAPNFGWRDVNLQEMIEDRFSHLSIIDNDVRVMALGEYWFGHGQNMDNMLCINVGYGIGSGIIFSGELYRGHNCLAGEIGHTTVAEDGPKCNCGDYGCLETLASGPAISRQMRKRIKRGEKSLINDLIEGDLDKITGEVVYRAARKGDDVARKVLADAGSYLGVGIANFVNVLDPEIVLLGGGVTGASEFFMENLKRTVSSKTMAEPPPIRRVANDVNAGVIGAGVLVLIRLFNAPRRFIKELDKPTQS